MEEGFSYYLLFVLCSTRILLYFAFMTTLLFQDNTKYLRRKFLITKHIFQSINPTQHSRLARSLYSRASAYTKYRENPVHSWTTTRPMSRTRCRGHSVQKYAKRDPTCICVYKHRRCLITASKAYGWRNVRHCFIKKGLRSRGRVLELEPPSTIKKTYDINFKKVKFTTRRAHIQPCVYFGVILSRKHLYSISIYTCLSLP